MKQCVHGTDIIESNMEHDPLHVGDCRFCAIDAYVDLTDKISDLKASHRGDEKPAHEYHKSNKTCGICAWISSLPATAKPTEGKVMTTAAKAAAIDWLEKHPEARPRLARNSMQREWRVYGMHHMTFWGPTLVAAIESAEAARVRNPGHHKETA